VARVNEETLQTTITELSQQGIFKSNDFAHPLFQEVTLKTLTPERKQHLARRAINVLEDKPDQAAMFVDEAQLEPERTLAILKSAASSTQEHNKVEAARFLAKAVDYATGEEKGVLALEAAKSLAKSDLTEALRLGKMALSLQPENLQIIELLMKIFTVLKQRDKAQQMLDRLGLKEAYEKKLQYQLKLYGLFHDHEATLALLEQHPDLLESEDAKILEDLIWVMVYTGQKEKAKTLLQHAWSLSQLTLSQTARLHYAQAIIFSHFDVDDD
jgi:tetratricopeptide (TPR) repeat protein